MVWQDIVLAIANILFGYSLVYQVYRGFKEKKGFLALQTSLFTTIGLFATAICFLSLGLFYSSGISFFNGTMWMIFLVQRLIYKAA